MPIISYILNNAIGSSTDAKSGDGHCAGTL